jgi:hypothetical protein
MEHNTNTVISCVSDFILFSLLPIHAFVATLLHGSCPFQIHVLNCCIWIC